MWGPGYLAGFHLVVLFVRGGGGLGVIVLLNCQCSYTVDIKKKNMPVPHVNGVGVWLM